MSAGLRLRPNADKVMCVLLLRFVVPAKRVKADPGVIKILCIQSTGQQSGGSSLIAQVADLHNKFYLVLNELLIDLIDYVHRHGIRVGAVVFGYPLSVGHYAEAPRGRRGVRRCGRLGRRHTGTGRFNFTGRDSAVEGNRSGAKRRGQHEMSSVYTLRFHFFDFIFV